MTEVPSNTRPSTRRALYQAASDQVATENRKREKFQLVFIDADKENNWNYVDIALGMVESGACIIVDNVVRKGQLAKETTDPRIAGARRVVENIGKDERLEGVVVQTVGDKNYDGFLFAVAK
ncbi:MAG: hypothetical protein M1823_007021 [Watsoniomyces obsoletus]|nr:MAG: hypothetical protein M1823_007021 [Watsoniomyces obsoletus]